MIIREVFQKLIPPLKPEEYNFLEASILSEGCREPLIMWGEVLIDGHNRYEICKKHGIEYKKRILDFDSEADCIMWILINQLGRRNLSAFDRAELALKMKPLLAEQAKENMSLGSKEGLVNSPNLNVRESLAKKADVGSQIISRVEKILKEATPEQIQEVRSGDKSINKAYQEIKKPHVTHNSSNNEWYTPKIYTDAAHRVMGGIDLDPASSERANQTVRAKKYFTEKEDGLKQQWNGRIWMNPPYSTGLIDKFVDKLVQSYKEKAVYEAIVLVNNATETNWFQDLASVANTIVFPNKRIRFISADGTQGSPLQGQAIFYLGKQTVAFLKEFAPYGLGVSICHQPVNLLDL